MTKGYSLDQDLRLLVNNPKYSDIEILCEDGKKLHACRAILAARSEIFDGLLYNGMKESYDNEISFPKINSTIMEIILEFTYTGSIKKDFLTKDNIVEAFCAADYFQLQNLQDFIMKTVKDTLEKDNIDNYSPELLSKVVEVMPLTDDNVLLNLLVETVATIHLNNIDFCRLSIAAFKYLLFYTHEKEKPFATSEYEVFRYCAILSAKQVSNYAFNTFMERLPNLEQMKNSIQVDDNNKFIANHQDVVKELEPLIKFIDFRRIKGQILTDIVEPLEIIPVDTLASAYRYIARSNHSELGDIRGIPLIYIWDKSACGPKLSIENNGMVVQASKDCNSYQCVRGRTMFEDKEIFEWDVIVEKTCDAIFIGVCASENFNFKASAKDQTTGWVLASYNGSCYNSGEGMGRCSTFGDGAKITVHLDMNKKTCTFTINGKKYSDVTWWKDLPSKLYPVVSLKYPGRVRIQHHINSKKGEFSNNTKS